MIQRYLRKQSEANKFVSIFPRSITFKFAFNLRLRWDMQRQRAELVRLKILQASATSAISTAAVTTASSTTNTKNKLGEDSSASQATVSFGSPDSLSQSMVSVDEVTKKKRGRKRLKKEPRAVQIYYRPSDQVNLDGENSFIVGMYL